MLVGGSPGLVAIGEELCSRGREFESQHRMDILSHECVVKFCIVCLKIFKLTEKEAEDGLKKVSLL